MTYGTVRADIVDHLLHDCRAGIRLCAAGVGRKQEQEITKGENTTIKIENGNVEITGVFPDIMANLSTLVHHLYHNILTKNVGMSPEKAKETILSAVEDGFMSNDEVHAKALEALEKMKNHPELFLDMLQSILSKKG